jgi:hypothetical protein
VASSGSMGYKRIIVLTIAATAFGITLDYFGIIDRIANALP